jgi:protein TonB
VEKPEDDTPQVPVKPKRKEPDRLKIAKEKRESPPQRQPAPEPEPVSPSVPETGTETATTGQATPQTGLAAGAVGGIAGGVVGGVQGGVIGGVIGGSGSGPIPVGQVANPPLLLSRVVPEYPQLARRRGIEGLVVLEAILDHQGKIEDEIKVLQSVPLLDEAAIQAVRQWRFKPARDQHGRAVRVILEVPIRFVLN